MENGPFDIGSFDIGIIGLGVMGRNLALNMLDHGFSVAGLDTKADQAEALNREAREANGKPACGFTALQAFTAALRSPKKIVLLVPAGAPVDSAIRELLPHLGPGDFIMDGGNSHFTDTDRRQRELLEKGIDFLGVGISGGEEGARHGPSLMPGGPEKAYARVKPILEAIAARVDGEPCVTWLGPGSAGHYVKMVHNGIEYALMQLISETYALMKQGLGLHEDELSAVYQAWNEGECSGYLMEITAQIFRKPDDLEVSHPSPGAARHPLPQGERGCSEGLPGSARPQRERGCSNEGEDRLINRIKGIARQKGTGMWTSQDAMAIGVPIPTIDMAVAMRGLSAIDRGNAAPRLPGTPAALPDPASAGKREQLLAQIRNAYYAAMILTFTQGMLLLKGAMSAYSYTYSLAEIARIWRGGCIIRTALLEKIRTDFRDDPNLSALFLAPTLAAELAERQADLRSVVTLAISRGIPVNGLMTALGFYDAFRQDWLPANLIQAQRDFFGAHGYERTDREGFFHTHWLDSPDSPLVGARGGLTCANKTGERS